MTLIGLGVLGLITSDFPPTWSGVPTDLPAREALAWLCAAISLGAGAGLLWRRSALLASRVLLTWMLAWLVLFRMSYIIVAPLDVDTWWACGDTALMAAAAWVIYAGVAGDRPAQRRWFATGDKGRRFASVLYAAALIPFGIAHFTYLARTVSLVPGWLPWPTLWASATGAAFIVAAVAILTGTLTRLAVTLLAVQLALFTLLVWVLLAAERSTVFDWNEFVDSWALTAGAWVVAESYYGTRWRALRDQV